MVRPSEGAYRLVMNPGHAHGAPSDSDDAAPDDVVAQTWVLVPAVSRTGAWALTQNDIDRVLSDDCPGLARLKSKLARFRYCDPCQSWRSGVPTARGEREELACWVCGSKMGSPQSASEVA